MKHSLIAKAEMLIRKPVAEVFEAFVNPAITSKFWFSKGSGRLEAGKEVTWDWEMYHFSVSVKVKAVKQNARILVEWPGYGAPTLIEWIFRPRADDTSGSRSGTRFNLTLCSRNAFAPASTNANPSVESSACCTASLSFPGKP
jgi:uncharacterized protein YndB with AHSA1/START domain